ncbi:MAG: hypothetical protein OHK0046_47630 [Anaerolineae bacterium]
MKLLLNRRVKGAQEIDFHAYLELHFGPLSIESISIDPAWSAFSAEVSSKITIGIRLKDGGRIEGPIEIEASVWIINEDAP